MSQIILWSSYLHGQVSVDALSHPCSNHVSVVPWVVKTTGIFEVVVDLVVVDVVVVDLVVVSNGTDDGTNGKVVVFDGGTVDSSAGVLEV